MVRTMIFVPRTMMTMRVLAFHSMVPPRALTIGAIGENVQPHLTWGLASISRSTSLTLRIFEPIVMAMTLLASVSAAETLASVGTVIPTRHSTKQRKIIVSLFTIPPGGKG